jgi:hypothetical protein
MPRISFILPFLLALLTGSPSALAEEEPPVPASCAGQIKAAKEPSPVDVQALLAAAKELRTTAGAPLLDLTDQAQKEFRDAVDPAQVKNKMEQFFRLTFVAQAHAKAGLSKILDVDVPAIRKILILSGVFDDETVPNQITGVKIDRSWEKDPRYNVTFKGNSNVLHLNGGKGFHAWVSGRCQHNESLIFYRELGFSLRILPNGNLLARYFRGADLYGDFGVRGIVDVDLNYIALSSVEFFRGTKMGEVTARVSEEEFRKNEHNALLRLVTRFVKNTSVQPIDW